jgi:hypothetical protein
LSATTWATHCNFNHISNADQKCYLSKAAAAACTTDARIVAPTPTTTTPKVSSNRNIVSLRPNQPLQAIAEP